MLELMKTLAIALLLIANAAQANDAFDARIQRAKAVEDSSEGTAFQRVLWSRIGDYTAGVMNGCVPDDYNPWETNSFVLVANLTSGQSVTMVEVRPETKIAQCFARGFSHAPFPEPPQKFGSEGIPLVIEMTIKP